MPTRQQTTPRTRAPRGGPTRAVLCAIMLSAGCSSLGPTDGVGALDRIIASGRRDLRALTAPVPPGAPDVLAEPPADADRAVTPLEDALTAVTPETAPTPPAASQPTAESLRLYISGRSRRLAGDVQGAIAELQAAAQADPGAVEPWRELAAAHRQQGDMLSAVAAHRQALRLDPTDAESLLRVGLWSLERRDPEAAASNLALARRLTRTADSPLGDDPGAGFVIDFNLGRALVEEGYLLAGSDLLGIVRDLPEQFDAPTRFTAELDAVYRQRAEGLRDAGDALFRIARYDSALAVYQTVAGLPTLDPAALLPRVTFAAMRAGRPAIAARALVDALASSADLSGERLLPLIRTVSNTSDVGRALTRAITELRESTGEGASRQVRSLLMRAQAATQPPARAADALRDWLAANPSDAQAVQDLFTLTGEELPAVIGQTLRLIDAAPIHEARYAHALLEAHGDPDAALGFITNHTEPAASILRARLLLETDRPGAAADALAGVPPRGAVGAVATTLHIEALARVAREPEAEALLTTLNSAPTTVRALLRARALAALNRPGEALDELREALVPSADNTLVGTPVELDASLFAATLAWTVGDADAVEHYAERALDIDPAAESAHARLIDLYRRGGPLADPMHLAAAVRRLREANPSSRTLRWHRARDLVAAGQYDRAVRDLLGLAEERTDPAIVDLLVALWVRTGSADQAESWLRERLRDRPHDATLVRSLARVLTEDKRAEDAVTLLDEWLTGHPYDDATARQAEAILRDSLKRVVEADDRSLARLDARPPTLARALERAEILVRRNDTERAAMEVLAALESTPSPAPGLAQPLIRDVLMIAKAAIEDGVTLRPTALILIATTEDRLGALPIEMHDQRLALLAQTDAPFAALTDALSRALTAFPARANELAAVAVSRLTALEKPDLGARLAAHALTRLINPDARFFTAWIQASFLALDADSARQAVRAVTGSAVAADIMTALGLGAGAQGDRGAANLALAAADYFALNGAETDDAIGLYDLVLEFAPDHELALNNYGYYLADHGLRLDDAERMIRRSLELDPSSGPTLDSLGWVLYKRGVIHDVTDDTGTVVTEGAVTVLERAARLPANQVSAEVIDHLGDALWAADQRDRARRRWQASVSLLEEAVQQSRQNPRAAEVFTADLARVRGKITAAQAGNEPQTAPIVGPINAPTAVPADAPGEP